MAANHATDQRGDSQVKRRDGHEGPRNHIISFIISIVLTVLAFIAVMYGDQLNASFIVPFILMLALFQVVIQLYFWMHLKDRGHTFPAIGIIFGVIIVFTAVIAALYWMWW